MRPSLDHRLHFVREPQKAQHVGDVAAALADALRQRILGVAELGDETLIALGLLERVQILALHILDEREFERVAVAHFAQQHRHFVQLGALRRAPAPLAGEDLEFAGAARVRAHQKRLQHALRRDRLRQRVERFLVEAPARLEAAGVEALDRHALDAARRLARFIAQKRRKPAPQAAPRVRTHATLRSRRSNSPARCT